MTDRTSELVAEFSKDMDARTYDKKIEAVIERVIDHFDSRIDTLTSIVERHLKITDGLTDRIIVLEEQVKTLESQQGTL